MLSGILLLCAVGLSGVASAGSTSVVTFVGSTTVTTCSYKSSSGGVPPTPIPTHNIKTSTTLSIFSETKTVPSTVSVTAPTTVTVTQRTAIAYTAIDETVTVPTSTRGVGVLKQVATATFAATVCSGGVKQVTVTKYTGTYSPISGQPTSYLATYPTEAFCTTQYIWTHILYPTLITGATTKTVTATSVITAPTTTSTTTLVFGTQYTYLTTVTQTFTSYTPAALTTTSTVACPTQTKTVTRTMDIRCAPSNIVGTINGEGLQSGDYADRTSVVYTRNEPWANDASECCQTCLDNEGCGASMGGDGACGLYYTATVEGEPVCNARIFTFTSNESVAPGQGLTVQGGCGSVAYAGES